MEAELEKLNMCKKEIRKYGRDFLLKLRQHPLSVKKPESLPNLDIIKKKIAMESTGDGPSLSSTALQNEFYLNQMYAMRTDFVRSMIPHRCKYQPYYTRLYTNSSRPRISLSPRYSTPLKNILNCYRGQAQFDHMQRERVQQYESSKRVVLPIIDPETGKNILEDDIKEANKCEMKTILAEKNDDDLQCKARDQSYIAQTENSPTYDDSGYEDAKIVETDLISSEIDENSMEFKPSTSQNYPSFAATDNCIEEKGTPITDTETRFAEKIEGSIKQFKETMYAMRDEKQRLASVANFLLRKKKQLEEVAKYLDNKKTELESLESFLLHKEQKLQQDERCLKAQEIYLLEKLKMLGRKENLLPYEAPESYAFQEERNETNSREETFDENSAKDDNGSDDGEQNEVFSEFQKTADEKKTESKGNSETDIKNLPFPNNSSLNANFNLKLEKLNFDFKKFGLSSHQNKSNGSPIIDSTGRRFLPDHIQYWLNMKEKNGANLSNLNIQQKRKNIV